ncbi:metallophosphoesterase family protein [Streptomyces spectabilis]|uniref:Metallophosphoesterase family protein n=1 Tax=Streptomyces spectabilis TaxID=68270 RepID=A0A516RH63_STRST|nr:metallophosphoesterase family protein [Streptomyces spectabilis]QDQ15002.1 metallophosphoesterase family protein [Streptomyces spectabilis]
MRYAVVTDIHGDTSALRAVLARVRDQGLRRIICLGDVFECHISKHDVTHHTFTDIGEVFDQEPELAALLDGALVLRGNQEERIGALVPDQALPAWARPVLDAPLTFVTDFATYCHGHALPPWHEPEPGLWCPLDAEFGGRALFYGHHHRSALHRLPDTGRDGEGVVSVPPRFGAAVPLAPDARYLVNVGPVRGPRPAWAVVDETEATVTHYRIETPG